MHQHWVPASYLRAWHDPASEHLKDPYVWRFSKDGSEIRRKSPHNLFRESNMYTFTDEDGQPNLAIETGLGRLEDQFKRLRRDKILPCEPLTDEDKAERNATFEVAARFSAAHALLRVIGAILLTASVLSALWCLIALFRVDVVVR